MSRFCPLFSSSKGNSAYLSGGGTSLLVDAGVSFRQLSAALQQNDIDMGDLSAILITHEHTDHIRGLNVLLKKCPIPVYASPGTLSHLISRGYLPPGAQAEEITAPTFIGGVLVTPFPTPHDACDSIGFRFEMPDQRKIAVATDLGHVTEDIRRQITGCDLVMLESNYDPGMLDCSPYPYYLKRRIRGMRGHLSNEDCSSECMRLIRTGTTRLVLAHLSEQNNFPAIAYQSVQTALQANRMRENSDYILQVAPARGETHMTVF